MYNEKCLLTLLNDNSFDLPHIVKYYISYISVFYCKNINVDESILNNKIDDLENYIIESVMN